MTLGTDDLVFHVQAFQTKPVRHAVGTSRPGNEIVVDVEDGAADTADRMIWHGTTILTVRKGGKVVVAGDGQVSLGDTVIKGNARKVRPLGSGNVIAGFAGATADAMTLFERLEAKHEEEPETQ